MESEEFFQAIFEQAADGIFIANEHGNYVEVNRRGCEMLGYTHEEILIFSFHDLVLAEDLAHNLLQLDALQPGSSLLTECRLRCKDGRFLPVEINTQMLGDGRFLSIMRDISKRKQVERGLTIREQEYRALVKNSPDFIARYDRELRCIYVNPAIQKVFEEPVESLLGQKPDEQSLVYDPEAYIDQLRQAIETATEGAIEMPFSTAEGEMHWGHIRFVPEFDPDGQVASVLAIGRNIHEIKEKESHFRMLAENFPDFVIRFDHDCMYTYVNPAVEKAFGHQPLSH